MKYLSQKWGKFKNSKFFLAVIMLSIGISYTTNYFMLEDLFRDYKDTIQILDSVETRRALIGQDMGATVPAVAYLDLKSSLEPSSKGTESPQGSPESLIQKYFGDQAHIALAVAKAESSLNPKATNLNRNGSTDTGLFQINSIHGYETDYLLDVENNVKVAYEIYKKAGNQFTPWVAYNTGAYQKYENI